LDKIKNQKSVLYIRGEEKQTILCFAVLTFIFAFLMPDRATMLSDYRKIITSQAYLIHDFVAVGGLAATFFNVAQHLLLAYILLRRNNRGKFSGFEIAATGVFTALAFFGTNIINVIPIILGVYFYSLRLKKAFSLYSTLSLFSCAMAPLVSYIMFVHGFSLLAATAAYAVGILIGFVTVPLAEAFIRFHQGYTLFNVGFTTGLVAMLITSFFGYFDLKIDKVMILSKDEHYYLLAYVLLFIVFLFVLFVWQKDGKWWHECRQIWRSNGRAPSDFYSVYGRAATLFNIILNVGFYLVLVLLLRFPLNGTIIGGLLTVAGFSSFGMHPFNCFKISLGVLAATLIAGRDLASQQVISTLLFANGLAPLGGAYGCLIGIIAGFIHFNLVNVVFSLHLGMSLYNNGFTSAFVAAVIVPLAEILLADKWRQE
jgi:hypothetical protein